MAQDTLRLVERLTTRFGDKLARVTESLGQVTIEVAPEHLVEVSKALRDDRALHFEQLMDLCGVDYLGYGEDEWDTDASSEGYSRGIEGSSVGRFDWESRPQRKVERRFAVVTHLLSVANNERVRVRTFCTDDFAPSVPSVIEVWSAASWFEREAFDLYGIVFEGHPDLRRLLTDYGFVGHPFRKDFPLIGNVEVRYDPEKNRVVYEPVSIEPRVLVPRTVRDDSRYEQAAAESTASDRAGKPEGTASKGL